MHITFLGVEMSKLRCSLIVMMGWIDQDCEAEGRGMNVMLQNMVAK